jgi:hypothetical protein
MASLRRDEKSWSCGENQLQVNAIHTPAGIVLALPMT